jgi:hypothetical protein
MSKNGIIDQKRYCAFCDNSSNITKEHVIPRWLQAHFELSNKRMMLWNGTSIFYRQAIIPACYNCNTERFSKLEDAIKNNNAEEKDYYVWGLKIRHGMAVRDSLLDFDRRDPRKGPLLQEEVANYGADFIKPILRYFDKPGFTFQPNPFGSVFIFTKDYDDFDFIDVPHPYRAVGITLPENRLLIVLLADRGIVKKVAINMGIIKFISDNINDFNLRLIMFTLLRLQNRIRIPRGVEIRPTSVKSEAIPRILHTRPQQQSDYLKIANYCSLAEQIARAAYEADAFMDKMKYVLVI